MQKILDIKPEGEIKYGIRAEYDILTRRLFIYIEDGQSKGLFMVVIVDKNKPRAYIDFEDGHNNGIVCVAGLGDRLIITPGHGVTVDEINGEECEIYDGAEAFDGQEIGMIIFSLVVFFFGIVVSLML